MTDNQKKDLIEKIAEKYSLKLILLFGSRAAGNNYVGSDFDIAYLSEKELNLEEESHLILALTPIFNSENIDLVNLKNSQPLLLYAITQNPQILYQKNPFVFYELRAYAFHLYIETQPLFSLQKELLELYNL